MARRSKATDVPVTSQQPSRPASAPSGPPPSTTKASRRRRNPATNGAAELAPAETPPPAPPRSTGRRARPAPAARAEPLPETQRATRSGARASDAEVPSSPTKRTNARSAARKGARPAESRRPLDTAAPVAVAGPSASRPEAPARPRLSAAERYRLIAEAAYYLAERRGFAADPVACWLEAEREIDARLGPA